MMISSLVSPYISASTVVNASGGLCVPIGSGDEGAAEVQPAFPDLALLEQFVRLPLAGPDQVHDLLAAREEQLRDQPPMAAMPVGLGAHQARNRLGERLAERSLPVRRPHACGVAAEGRDADAREALLAGLAAQATAELDRVPVVDARRTERLDERRLPELRVSPRARVASDVDERLH